jgi:hypothetical protein
MKMDNSHNYDLGNFLPSNWSQIAGNKKLKEYLLDLISGVRNHHFTTGYNALVVGDSREGKTATIKLGIKCVGCYDFDFTTMNPCGKCPNCTMNHHLWGNTGYENYCDMVDDKQVSTPIRYRFVPIDCTRVTPKEMDELIVSLQPREDAVRIIYLDEIHRLVRKGMDLDHQLLKPMEELEAIWIASSANVKNAEGKNIKKLEKMFLNRFDYVIETEKPDIQEFSKWVMERCVESGVQIDDPETVLPRLAARSSKNIGMALKVLNKAHKRRSKTIDIQLVEDQIFNFDEAF